MDKVLVVKNKLLSLRGNIFIYDENGEQVYDAKGSLSLFSPKYTLSNGNETLAVIKKRFWSITPKWDIESNIGPFKVRRKLLSWRRKYCVHGGSYNGAQIKGNLLDLKFKVTHYNEEVANATGKVLTLRDTHNVVVKNVTPERQLFTAIVLVILQMEKKSESSGHGGSD